MTKKREVRQLLGEIRDGADEKQELLLPLIYEELEIIARRQLANQRADHTLQPTALVHEASIKLASGPSSERDRELEPAEADL